MSSSVWTITLEDAVGTGCTGSRIDVSVDGPVQPAFSEGEQLMVELAGYDGSLDQLNLLLVLRDMRGSLVFGAFSHAVEQWVGLGAAAALGFDARFEERCEVSDPGCNEAVVQYDAIVSDDEGEQRLQPSQRAPLKIQGVVYELDYYGSTDFRGLTRTTCFPPHNWPICVVRARAFRGSVDAASGLKKAPSGAKTADKYDCVDRKLGREDLLA